VNADKDIFKATNKKEKMTMMASEHVCEKE